MRHLQSQREFRWQKWALAAMMPASAACLLPNVESEPPATASKPPEHRGADGCVDLDECLTDNGGCDTSPVATCSNRLGAAPSCKCPDDSAGDGVGTEGCTPMTAEPPRGVACGKFFCDGQTANDPATGLTWQRVLPAMYEGCSGQLVAGAGARGDSCIWEDAKSYCSHLNLVSNSSWRLPTKDELLLIVDKTRTDPSIDIAPFPNTPSEPFWFSSAFGTSTLSGMAVDFKTGVPGSYVTSRAFRVRCVR